MKKTINRLGGVFSAVSIMAVMGCTWVGVVDFKETVDCMTANIYHEARGESVKGQYAVAHVTMNRVSEEHWPGDICSVVYESKQFSWTFKIKNQTPRDLKAWKTAVTIARDVMIGNTTDPTLGAQFYHAGYVNPTWNKEMDVSKVIGSHIFYKWDGTWDDGTRAAN